MALNHEQILDRFNTNEFPPVLDKPEQLAVRKYLEEQGMVQIFGSIPTAGQEPSSTRLLLSHDHRAPELLESQHAVVGPYFLDDDYYPSGIGVWVRSGSPGA